MRHKLIKVIVESMCTKDEKTTSDKTTHTRKPIGGAIYLIRYTSHLNLSNHKRATAFR